MFQMLPYLVSGFVEQICDMNISVVAIFIPIGLKGDNMQLTVCSKSRICSHAYVYPVKRSCTYILNSEPLSTAIWILSFDCSLDVS